jgi:hypothetical protein
VTAGAVWTATGKRKMKKERSLFEKKAEQYEKRARAIAKKERARGEKPFPLPHLLDTRDRSIGYKKGWMDVSERMLIVPFKLLCTFVEGELYNPKNVQIDWKSDPEHAFAKSEIDHLYVWWKEERPSYVRAMESIPFGPTKFVKNKNGQHVFPPLSKKGAENVKKFSKMEDTLRGTDTANLIRLMKIRGALWT